MYINEIDLPTIPDSLVSRCIEYIDELDNQLIEINGFKFFKMLPSGFKTVYETTEGTDLLNNSLGMSTQDAEKVFQETACIFKMLPAPLELKEWLESNIPFKFVASLQEFSLGKQFMPHIDMVRRTAFNYIITEGGSEVKTIFYEPKAEFKNLNVIPRTIINYDRINPVQEIVCEKNKWYRLNVDHIHSVENLDPTLKRISLTLSIIE